MEIYMIAVILKPTEKQVFDEGTSPQIVVQPVAVLAKDEQQAAMKAFKFVPDEYAGMEDRLEVKILPFRSYVR